MKEKEALEIAIGEISGKSFTDIAVRCGLALGEHERVSVKYLGDEYVVSPEGSCVAAGGQAATERTCIIILHYLGSSSGKTPSGKLIDFREVPGGNVYNPVFEKRVHGSFLGVFGSNASLFQQASGCLGGKPADFGDSSFRFSVLPRVPVWIVLHAGDAEFPPACKFLFDSTIREHLSTEDIVTVCEDLVRKLKGSTK